MWFKIYRNKLTKLQDKDFILTLENKIRGCISSVMGNRYVELDENKNIIYADANNLYDHSISQPLPYDEIERWHGHRNLYLNKLEETLKTPDDSDIGYFIEVDLIYPDNIKKKTKKFPFCPENKKIIADEYKDFMNKIKPKTYTKVKKINIRLD